MENIYSYFSNILAHLFRKLFSLLRMKVRIFAPFVKIYIFSKSKSWMDYGIIQVFIL